MAGLKGSVIVTTLLVLTFIDPVTPDDMSARSDLLTLMKTIMDNMKNGKDLGAVEKDLFMKDLKTAALFADLDVLAVDRVLMTAKDFNTEAILRCEEDAFIVETKDVHESIFIQAALKARYSDVQHCDGFRMGVHLDNVRKLFPLDLHVCPFATMNVTRHGDGGKDSPYTMEVYADTLIGRLNAVGDMDTIGTSLKEVSIPPEQETYSCEVTMTAKAFRMLMQQLNWLGKQFTISCTLQDMNVTVTDNGGSHSFLIRHSTRMELEASLTGQVPPRSFVTAKVYSSTRVEVASSTVTLRLAPTGPLVLHYQLKKDADGLLKNHSHVTFFMDSTQQ
ncbi:proliferating cell nuclear antigen-like isoform X1 [Branchiostoma floridae]|uniref:Proliferating cell nuclear antigen-like isoform X1 n=1 Tax=Branchiostoma floridae TaxID=7739 RepID=A0A9J7KWI1_BRAFL|nr:proliferating cell nuclear antigen-like isoform X1 [Branchiostoma floridae]